MDHYDSWFSWNHDKYNGNLKKHNTSFYDACEVFYDVNSATWNTYDGRFITIGRSRGTYYTVIWEYEGSLRRIISARYSNDDERRRYDRENNR